MPLLSCFYGLVSAKTFHQLHPDASLAVLESSSSVGGVWSWERLYPSLRTNNLLGTYEYPDFPMDTKTFGIKPGEHIPGEVMYRYLNSYAKKFDIRDKIRLQTVVSTAEHQDGPDGGWVLTVKTGGEDGEEKQIFARKLVMATGLTSQPFLPHIEGQEGFGAPIYHSREFAQYTNNLDTAKKVVVFGGTKSAFDVVYAYAIKGVKVEWVIRESGHGPAWIAPPYVTPLKRWLEKLAHTRFLTWFSPCIWGNADGYTGIRNFYHGTALGRAITNIFWSILGNDVLTLNKYDAHPETKKLKPWSQAMFVATSLGILNYPTDFFDLVRNGTVSVHIADIQGLSSRTVHLAKGAKLENVDALCCATGWKHLPPVKFLPEGIDKELGLPHKLGTNPDDDDNELFSPSSVAEADKTILSRFPRLRDQPVQNKRLAPLTGTPGITAASPEDDAIGSSSAVADSAPLTPWGLYRFVVPPSARFMRTRDIAFTGMLMNFSAAMGGQVQALWITAYFTDRLSPAVLPSRQSLTAAAETETGPAAEGGKSLAQVRDETRLHARFGRWRYPAGHGSQFPDFVFDCIPYLDLLLGDLGVRVHRKSGWFAEMTEPYGPKDYEGVMAEFEAKKE
ncbi:hypothetical protein B0J18DRAFT_462100 [Chaetomium sp. MPI-SDFR-AT-0129]|nr:hypothetical protein B0J18DRAFT_462100 [Chaetomium sp. MPI-SDFR-AT-0129]